MDECGSPLSPRRGISPLFAALALAAWAALTFGHGIGSVLAGRLFAWAKVPGTLLPEGGAAGFVRIDRLLVLGFGLLAVLGLTVLAARLGRPGRRCLLEAAAPWAVWGMLAFLAWRCYIVLATELVHFFQYALVGGLACWALGRGRRPQLAFLLATALGALDEAWQHYGLHGGDPHHWLDWSDLMLNALGSAAGVLPFTTLARARGEALAGSFRLVWRAMAVATAVCVPLLLLSPATAARLLGPYPYYPFWSEYDNRKPVHWPSHREGIPLFLASLLVLGSVVEPGRRPLSHGALLCLTVLLALAVHPESRLRGRTVHLQVPSVRVPRAAVPAITVDGALVEPAWQQAARLGPFVESATGRPSVRGSTRARLLWDEKALYVAFEVEDPDVWSRLGGRDTFDANQDEGVCLLIDEGGDEITYYAFELAPSGAVSDLFSLVPGAPLDYNPDNRHIGLVSWDPQGVGAAVRVDGTLSPVAGWASSGVIDQDRGYTVEMAIPWQVFRTTSTPYARSLPPRPGDRWRLDLCRTERPRVPAGELATAAELGAAQVCQRLGISPAKLAQLRASGRLEPATDGRDAYPLSGVLWMEALRRAEYQAWAPTYYEWFHVPARFGVLEFAGG
ncbi:MAG: carbohydrate-binding family 9-like protein [Candidatus Latescibacterota bacterium]